MFITKRLTGLLAILLLAIAPGCFIRNQDSPQAASPSPTQTASTPTPAAPAVAPPEETPQTAPEAEPTAPEVSPTPETATSSSSQVAVAPTDCANAQTQAEINQCAQASYVTADAELNRVYQNLKTSLNSQEQEELIDAELAWIDYRDETCDAESSQYEGGSIQPTIYYGCLERVTAERTAELQQQLEQSQP
ncbi:MAG: DUF1311 domain-containing protein [Leptolyngbyaceae cyanobacterium RM2_2_4]|nr:DUF1311 domain-containing protein [Leptolyngbyaceae cyanobacterium SM1_4_3]NJN56483.1 DUF1311 domain-containing protein [Leptolyngbyaceae cyanobacterium SL_5_9]NJO50736.1 DUF1311 domain-containing protein [Leptolyngbyaceae cyanobacterium RM2_2_4]